MPTLIEQRLAEREADTTERRPTLIEQRLAERGGKAPAPPRTVSDLDRALLEGPMPYAGPQQHEVEAQLLENPIERLQSERTGAAERRRALRHTIKSPDVNQSASLEYPSYLSREQLGWSTDAEDAEDTEDAPERRESPDDAIRRHIARIDQYAENIKRAKRAGYTLDFGGVASDTAYTDAELRAIAKWVKADWVPERRFADASIQTGDFTPAEAKRFLTIFKDLQQDKDVTAWVNTMRQRARNAATAHELSKRIHNVLWLPKNGVARAVWTGIGAASLSVAATASRSFNPRLADDINRLTHAQELAAGRMDMKSAFPAILLRGTRSATRSVITAGAASFTGMYGISLAFGATRYNDAMTEARDAGLGTGAARKYALRAAGIEAGIAMAFTRLGMGGFEKMMSGRGVVTKAGLKAFLRRTGVSLLHELPEENITELADNLNQALSEIEPQSLTLANTWATVRDTTISTIIAMGMGNVSAELGGRPAAKDITENVRTFIDKLPADTVARLAKVSTEGGVSRAVMPKVSKADWRLAVVNAAKERVAEEGIEETPAPKPAEGRAAITAAEGRTINDVLTGKAPKHARVMQNLQERGMQNEAVDAALDDLIEKEANPKEIVRSFFTDTYPQMSPRGKKHIQALIQRHVVDAKPGDVKTTKADGTVERWKDWHDIAEDLVKSINDLPALEQGEGRGAAQLVAWMQVLREQAKRKGEPSDSETEGRVARREPQREEPGRPVQEPRPSPEAAESGRIFQEAAEVQQVEPEAKPPTYRELQAKAKELGIKRVVGVKRAALEQQIAEAEKKPPPQVEKPAEPATSAPAFTRPAIEKALGRSISESDAKDLQHWLEVIRGRLGPKKTLADTEMVLYEAKEALDSLTGSKADGAKLAKAFFPTWTPPAKQPRVSFAEIERQVMEWKPETKPPKKPATKAEEAQPPEQPKPKPGKPKAEAPPTEEAKEPAPPKKPAAKEVPKPAVPEAKTFPTEQAAEKAARTPPKGHVAKVEELEDGTFEVRYSPAPDKRTAGYARLMKDVMGQKPAPDEGEVDPAELESLVKDIQKLTGEEITGEEITEPTPEELAEIEATDISKPLTGDEAAAKGVTGNVIGRVLRRTLAKIEKAYNLRTNHPEVYEALRHILGMRELNKDRALRTVVRLFGDPELTKEDAATGMKHTEIVSRWLENPKKYKLPDNPVVQKAAEKARKIYDWMGGELSKRGLVGLWPESAIKRLEAERDQAGLELVQLKQEAAKERRRERINQLEGRIKKLRTLRYTRRSILLSHYLERAVTKKGEMSSKAERLLGRKVIALEDLDAADIPWEKDFRVALADYMAYAQQKISIYEAHEQLKKAHPELILKDKKAPADWVTVPGNKQYNGYRVHPFFAEALRDYSETVTTSGLGRVYDRINSMFKQTRFYKFMIMVYNNVQQQFGLVGLRGVPQYKEAYQIIVNRDKKYEAMMAGDLFPMPSDIPQLQFLDQARMALEVTETNLPKPLKVIWKASGIKNWQDALKSMIPSDRHLLLRMNRELTWWLDRLQRVSTTLALEKSGMPLPQAIQRARLMHADYNVLRAGIAKWMRRIMLVPAYKTAMWYRLGPDVFKGVIRGAQTPYDFSQKEALGVIGRSGIMFAIAGVLAAIQDYAWTQGYRFVKKAWDEKPSGEKEEVEKVVLLPGVIGEPLKVVARARQGYQSRGILGALQRVMYNNLAVLPHFVMSWTRNRDWKGERIITPHAPAAVQRKEFIGFTLRELYPLLEEAGNWTDPEKETVDNLLALLAITRYTRKPMQGYYTRRAKQTINGLRRWAQTEAKKDPENADYYHKYAAEEAMSRLEDLDAYVRQYVSKVDDFQEMKALNRLWRQFIPETHYPARPEAKGVLDDVTASKVYQATGSLPRRKQGESRGAYEARRKKHQSNIDFARAYIREQKLSKKELRKILRKAAGRRGQNLAGDAFLARLRKLEGLLNK